MFSVVDMFKIGVGPSSSHSVGPMLAAQAFARALQQQQLLDQVARIHVTLYGSLALTGIGHGTDRATLAGLEGDEPRTVDTDRLLHLREICDEAHSLNVAGTHEIDFDYERDIEFDGWHRYAAHPNGMKLEAFDADGTRVLAQVWYSIGGGFIAQGSIDDRLIGLHERIETPAETVHDTGESNADDADDAVQSSEYEHTADTGVSANLADEHSEFDVSGLPYPFTSAEELLAMCDLNGQTIADIVLANESAQRSEASVRADLLEIWQVMRDCVHAGCTSEQTVLPGGLDVPRRAPRMYAKLTNRADVLAGNTRRSDAILEFSDAAWVDLFALAVNEENAGGGRVVTAPTNGSAGIIPAVLQYYWNFVPNATEDGIVTFLLTAGAIGYLFKRNASISGAEVGCQGEVGSACSMAAAGLCAVLGGTPRQVENAAEIGIEHNLGLTCDPVAGLVQIPCIERNAIAANTAINAVRMAMLGNGSHVVTLDQAIRTMKETGADMMAKYKETSRGGLAVNVVEC